MFEMRPYRRNQINAWNPFADMDALEKSFFGDDFFGHRGMTEFGTDITDEGDAYKLMADLPGFEKKEIHLDLEGDSLTISAERHSEHEEKNKRDKYVCCERSYGSYRRSFDVSGIKANEISAKYDNGVLTLKMPKKDKSGKEKKQLNIE